MGKAGGGLGELRFSVEERKVWRETHPWESLGILVRVARLLHSCIYLHACFRWKTFHVAKNLQLVTLVSMAMSESLLKYIYRRCASLFKSAILMHNYMDAVYPGWYVYRTDCLATYQLVLATRP